ncbi:hypothetical protein K443DRAFT_124060 [Laccaria amethystina LaAM-08-1]|uniref:Uncharacterized protein n=1 Tax=Laccaria amethystina LaAM-08-1 TaxID=1095629 RepID=A0A0C9WXK7_9AGAR|nr:hypothetical protein K443DRAFT_124060 [Laccaria amethystina LaAM-08-1]
MDSVILARIQLTQQPMGKGPLQRNSGNRALLPNLIPAKTLASRLIRRSRSRDFTGRDARPATEELNQSITVEKLGKYHRCANSDTKLPSPFKQTNWGNSMFSQRCECGQESGSMLITKPILGLNYGDRPSRLGVSWTSRLEAA